MKTILLLVSILTLTAFATYASALPKISKPKASSFLLVRECCDAYVTFTNISPQKGSLKIPNPAMGRECCTRRGTTSNGATVEVTVCSGWLLSNRARAKDRACEAAQAAVDAQK